MGTTPNIATMLGLIEQTDWRILRTDEKRLLREGIRTLDRERATAGGLRHALHHADRDRITLAAACRRAQELVQRFQDKPPSAATIRAALDAFADALAPALNSVESP